MTEIGDVENKELFERTIEVWNRLPDRNEPLTLNQIAKLVAGKGSSKNASIVGKVLKEFPAYIQFPKFKGNKLRVVWPLVEADYPHLFDPDASEELPPIDGMIKALKHEIAAVRAEIANNPVRAVKTELLGQIDGDTVFYESEIDDSGDQELSIPEGVTIQLRWDTGLQPREATLLSYDRTHSRIIFSTERPLGKFNLAYRFRVEPKTDELVKAVRSKLMYIKSDPDTLTWRLLENHEPRVCEWKIKVPKGNMDPSQREAIEKCLSQDVTYLWGPPGTGKTYTLARLIAAAALAGKKIIATAIANVAVDQLALQLVETLKSAGPDGKRLLDEGRIFRYGHARLNEVVGEKRLFPNRERVQELRAKLHEAREKHRQIPETNQLERAVSQKRINDLTAAIKRVTLEVLNEAQVVLTTAVQVCMEPAFDEVAFDMMVVDEASMMPLPYLACMAAVPRERLVIAGDFR